MRVQKQKSLCAVHVCTYLCVCVHLCVCQVFVKKGEVESKMLSALLSGVNRAYPYAKGLSVTAISRRYCYCLTLVSCHADTICEIVSAISMCVCCVCNSR